MLDNAACLFVTLGGYRLNGILSPLGSPDLNSGPSAKRRDRAFGARSLIVLNGRYFLLVALFARAADPYRLLKHVRHRRSRRLMKLGARSSLPQ
jgi:hypothetical protein